MDTWIWRGHHEGCSNSCNSISSLVLSSVIRSDALCRIFCLEFCLEYELWRVFQLQTEPPASRQLNVSSKVIQYWWHSVAPDLRTNRPIHCVNICTVNFLPNSERACAACGVLMNHVQAQRADEIKESGAETWLLINLLLIKDGLKTSALNRQLQHDKRNVP